MLSTSEKKPVPATQAPLQDTEKGDIADASLSNSNITRLDPFGNPLVPTPTADALDPLNWSALQKNVCIAIICYGYFLFTYLTSAPIPSFALLQEQFGASYSQVNWSFAIPSLGLALGPLLCSALADIYGRRVVMIGGAVIALVASGCTSLHGISLGGYMAARFFQGIGASPAATVGLSIINDLSFEHERGFRIGLWVMAIDLGGLCGGFIGGFIATASQYWIAYHVTILFAFLLVLECFFLPETLYPRNLVLSTSSPDATSADIAIPRTKQLGYMHVSRIPGVTHPKPWATIFRFASIWSYPTVVISTLTFVFLQYWWICSFLTMEPAAYATYSLQVQGLFFTGLILGTVVAELGFSGRLSDAIMVRMAKKNNGVRVPEHRLWLGYPAAIICSIGLVVWALSIDREWHWITGQIAFFLFGAGLQMGNTALSNYIVDSYYEHAMDIITFYSVIINLSAFAEPFFINIWVEASGYTWSFAAQAIICTFGVIPVYIILQKFGAQWRRPMNIGTAASASPAAAKTEI
ncbi:MFS transporter-19 [Coleophoma cylindrospora]|uniref:MFS transporter-19 n=1 Tax=Coleophoma cylindrospora TaxID=1849047 RepID=A0A3D8SPT4_9HELO|nr:MFS transporter-19 [Coleophoma cylindrospora]